MSAELPEKLHKEITSLSAEGDALARKEKYDEAIVEYKRAWELLPEPREEWQAGAWLLAAIGDAHFLCKRFVAACDVFSQAILRCPGALGNPFLHLRLGESLFECGRQREAGDELMRAYMGAGADIFQAEDPKYLQYLKTIAIL